MKTSVAFEVWHIVWCDNNYVLWYGWNPVFEKKSTFFLLVITNNKSLICSSKTYVGISKV